MRQAWLCVSLVTGLVLGLLAAAPMAAALDKSEHVKDGSGHGDKAAHGPKFTKYEAMVNNEKLEFDLQKPEEKKALSDLVMTGQVEELAGKSDLEPMKILWDLGLWAVVIFVLLLII